MKKRWKTVAALALLLLQFFCIIIPTAAADETIDSGGGWVVESLSETTITDDFQKPLAELAALYPKTAEDKGSVELISAVTRLESVGSISLYFYFYSAGGFSGMAASGNNVTVRDVSGGNTMVLTLLTCDVYGTLLKAQATISDEDYAKYRRGDGYEFYVSSFALTWRSGTSVEKVTYDAITRQLDSGSLSSEIRLTVDPDGALTSWVIEEALKLDVHLSSERYSTAKANEFTQLNTAIFAVPNEYFYDSSGKYLTLSEIVYKYALYKDVPMLVHDSPYFTQQVDYSSIAKFGDIYYFGMVSSDIKNTCDPPIKHFVFEVEDIGTVEDADYDVKTDELLKAYNAAREHFNAHPFLPLFSFDGWIQASEYLPVTTYSRKVSESIKTESYADGATWWQKIFDGRFFGKNHDDSVTVNAIQTITYAECSSKTDEELMDEYALSEEGVADLRFVMNAVDDTYIGVVFHYLETSYKVDPIDAYVTSVNQAFPYTFGDAYIAQNAIIDEFQIIELHFGESDSFRIVPTVHPKLTYIGDLEGDDKLEDETFDPPEIDFSGFEKAFEKIMTVLRLILFVAIVVAVVWLVSKLVGILRSIFDGFRGRRK